MTTIRSTAALLAVLAATIGSARAQDATTRPGVTGTVESIDPATRTLVLDDGRTYRMREDADVSFVAKGAPIALACDPDGANCVVITSGPPTDAIPELQTNPSAGSTDEGGGSGN
jgi:Protein of unknown function (DUF1344)